MFKLSEEQGKKLDDWVAEQDAKVAAIQKRERAYYGCSGGAYTYSFTPTSLGTVVKVVNGVTKEEIDLTDYEDW